MAVTGDQGQAAARLRACRLARAISDHHHNVERGRAWHVETVPGVGAVRRPGCGCGQERLLFRALAAAQLEGWPSSIQSANDGPSAGVAGG